MKIAVIGTGYVGLVSGVCFAEFGFDVACVDNNPRIVERLSAGQVTIYEPGLDDMLVRNLQQKRLRFTTELADAVADAEIVFIAVGTPSHRGAGGADLKYIFAAADQIADHMRPGTVVAIKSTVVAGTCARVRDQIRARRPGVPFSMASNPEFLREGSAVGDFMRPDRIVVGAEDENGREAMRRLYRPVNFRDTPVVLTTLENAELIKYAANAFLAMKLTFINQVADLCEKVGADVNDVARGIGMDVRIGSKYLNAGPGFGGSCLPKDTRAFAATGREHGAPQLLIEAVVDINENRKLAIAARIVEAANEAAGSTVAILGVAFKPGTDDMREAPSLDIVPALQKAGLNVRAYDPEAMENAKPLLAGVAWCGSAYEAVEGADVTVLLTEWNDFRALDLTRVAELMRGKVLIDLRNVYQAADFAGTELAYHSVGRPPLLPPHG
jgi:UDPglucose 6-dehydrogenase